MVAASSPIHAHSGTVPWSTAPTHLHQDGGVDPLNCHALRHAASSACKFVLVGLANHAGPDGTGAFPSVATLVRYTGLSERTVRTCLNRLEAEGIIRPCHPAIVAARIKRPDRRPKGWQP